jgi:hypothetical protein
VGSVDIIVTGARSSHPKLVVEVKLRGSIGAATAQLASYMAHSGAPFGLVVTGDELLILRDTYRKPAPQSVEGVGPFATDGIDGLRPPEGEGTRSAIEFVGRVQDWLESLADPDVVARLPEPLRKPVDEYLVPIVEDGEVWAAGPRVLPAKAG